MTAASRTEPHRPSPRADALSLLMRVDRDGAYADRLLAAGTRGHDDRDRAFIRELVLGVLRWQLRLDRIIDMYYTGRSGHLHPEVRAILRLGLAQIMFMDSVPDWAAVSESVALTRSSKPGHAASGLVNAVLRRFLREGEPPYDDADIIERLAVRYAHPAWLVRRWCAAYGHDIAERMLAAGVTKHPVTIRTNTLRTTPGELAVALTAEGYAAVPVDGAPMYLSVGEAGGLFTGQAFTGGLFTVQDPAAGMASMLLDPRPGDHIADLCAAPGGKATHLAERSGDRAVIEAVDSNGSRLELVAEAASRLGMDSVRCIRGDAASFAPAGSIRYDRVLCDVPCSGTAVFTKRPDMKWRRTEQDIARMTALQRRILANAARHVCPGGVIVYSTCSMEHEENEDMVNWFVGAFPFRVERDDRFAAFETSGGYRILPHLMGGSGAFAAKLRHIGDA